MSYSMQWGPAPLPREHGGWAMLLTPLVIAVAADGPSLMGLTAAVGWILAYCLRGPLEVLRGAGATGRAGMARATQQVARLWLVIFLAGAAALLLPVIILRPAALGLLALAVITFMIVQALTDRGLTRSIPAGILAVIGLMAGGPLYYLAAGGAVTTEGWLLALACFAFFAGAVFRVKTLARERRSGSFRVLSVAIHTIALAGALAAAWMGAASWFLPVALAAPALWAVRGALRTGGPISLAVIGKGEQWLTILFGLLIMIALI